MIIKLIWCKVDTCSNQPEKLWNAFILGKMKTVCVVFFKKTWAPVLKLSKVSFNVFIVN